MSVDKAATTPDQQRTWEEVQRHCPVKDAWRDENDANTVVLSLDEEAADTFGIYEFLWILPDGRVAEAMVNQPFYYAGFSQLMTAANTRASAS